MSKFDTAENFKAHCLRQEATIFHYVDMNKSNYQQLNAETQQQLSRRESRYFHANNFRSRLRFTQGLVDRVTRYLDGEDIRDVRFVTITPDIFAMAEGEAATFDVRRIERWIEENLGNMDYVGVAEAAYYPSWPPGRITISWHAHLLVFNMHYRRYLNRRAEIIGAYKSLISGVDAITSAQVGLQNVAYKIRYMSKFPTYRYRPSQITVKAPAGSAGPGRIPTGRIGQNKDDLRPGELIRMCKVLANVGLDETLVAGGAGVAVVAPLIREATATVRFDKARRR